MEHTDKLSRGICPFSSKGLIVNNFVESVRERLLWFAKFEARDMVKYGVDAVLADLAACEELADSGALRFDHLRQPNAFVMWLNDWDQQRVRRINEKVTATVRITKQKTETSESPGSKSTSSSSAADGGDDFEFEVFG